MGAIIWPWTIAGTSGANDPNWSSVVLMLGGNGTNGSGIIPDESPAAHGNGDVSGVGNDTQLNTSIKKFGSAAIRFDGGNDILKWADHNDWSFGSGEFTVEGWFLFDAATIEANSPIIAHYEAGTNQREWSLVYRGDLGTNALTFVISTAGTSGTTTTPLSYNWTPTADTWYHIAVDRSGNSFRMYIDGAMVASATSASTLFASSAPLVLGNAYGSVEFFKGSMDEVRITKSVARYASDSGYTVPTAAFPRS